MLECLRDLSGRLLIQDRQASGQSGGKDHGVFLGIVIFSPTTNFLFHISELACLSGYYDPLDEKTCTSVTERGEDIQHLTF
jgi:hypothetical protein